MIIHWIWLTQLPFIGSVTARRLIEKLGDAHTVCLNTGGYTVAILGNGLDICYPAEHNKLMKCIEEKGLLISEYPPGTHPDRYRFPRRNRLISSWSDKLFVIQAEKGSGALITAEYSRKYGREVEME